VLPAGSLDVITGDASRCAHAELEARLRPFVARRVSPSDVDDVLQDVYLRVQRGLASLRDDERFGPWVYRVARNAIAEQRRTRARHPLAAGEAPDASDEAEPSEAPTAEEKLAAAVVPFIAMLASPYREALTLTELEGLTQQEAADMLGLSLSGMKSRVQRGRAQLRALFDACCVIALDGRGRPISCEPRGSRSPACRC
jgi:RNA polymerase sigma-70 factor (ECF subfamily)